MAGLTEHGLTIKRLHEVIADSKARAQPIFQDLVPPGDIVDTSDSTTIGRLIGLKSPAIADLWEAVQQVYLAFDPNSATGVSLDNLVAIGGISRFPESATTADVYITGNNGMIVPSGSVARSSTTGQTYELTTDVTLSPENCFGVGISIPVAIPLTQYSVLYRLGGSGEYLPINYTSESTPETLDIINGLIEEVENNHPSLSAYEEDERLFITSGINFQLVSFFTSGNLLIDKIISPAVVVAQEVGEIEQPPNTIDGIATPVFGWDAITNPVSANTGRLRESDTELRNRFRETKFQRATNIIESLYSALYDVTGTTSIVIYENDTDTTDSIGLPPHSFMVMVDGGLDTEIARAIWLNRPTGILSVGDTSVNILDDFGYIRNIRFNRPEDKEVYVRMSLTTLPSYPQDGNQRIVDALSAYVSSLNIGEDLVFSRLYTPINTVQGHQVDVLEVSEDGDTWVSANIATAINERVVLPVTNISFI